MDRGEDRTGVWVLEAVCPRHDTIRGQIGGDAMAFWPFELECPMCGEVLQPTILGRATREEVFIMLTKPGPKWQAGVEAMRKRWRRMKRCRDQNEEGIDD